MAHSHCTGPGPGTAPGMMGLYIMLCTVHTTQGHGWGQGQGQGTDGFQTYFTTGTGTGQQVFYYTLYHSLCCNVNSTPRTRSCPVPGPCSVSGPYPGPVQCESAISQVRFKIGKHGFGSRHKLNSWYIHSGDEKAFQSNTNHPLSDSPCFIVKLNKFEHIWGAEGGGAGGQHRGPVQGNGLGP